MDQADREGSGDESFGAEAVEDLLILQVDDSEGDTK